MVTVGEASNAIRLEEIATECCLCGGAIAPGEWVHTGLGWAHHECQIEHQWGQR